MFFTVRPLWLADLRIDQFPEVGLEALVRPLLISSHQARIARHIGGRIAVRREAMSCPAERCRCLVYRKNRRCPLWRVCQPPHFLNELGAS